MPQVITYLDPNGRRAIVWPAPDTELTLEEIAAKDVPQGLSWQIMDSASVPPQDPAILLADWRATASLTDIQFALACASLGYMTAAEAEAWVGRGEIPPLALAALALIPNTQTRALARIRFAGARTINRLDPFIPLLQNARTPALTEAEVDEIFTLGGTL